MSAVEENYIVAPWVGPTCCKNVLSVVVLSSNAEIIECISAALSEIHAKGNFRWKLVTLRSFHLEEVVRQSDLTGRIAIDFVVIGMDTSRIVCLDWTKKVIGQVHPDLRNRRVVLVNASGLPVNELAINADELISLQTELKVDMLTANVFKTDDALHLARRLLRYMEVSVGVKTGVPNLNV
ncbi:uncharacterized protein LOC126373383 [Pectinophora gossypiella]|uniref:uncharacterized protein LOC126373383 n=1 Tax=Pectinophora gossypiella TaxID=13191 RepID=UPI00214F2FCF|nr:uncharacterized protein LOC126373383 [Pectinophora gossypiella]